MCFAQLIMQEQQHQPLLSLGQQHPQLLSLGLQHLPPLSQQLLVMVSTSR
jgi:hypothetical protein